MNIEPCISIGIPVYNGDKYLKFTLESILQQNFKDFEIIISDNASSDQTESLCNHYQGIDKRIRYFRQNYNIGGVANFKYVFKNSRGKYFIWIAADDLLGDKNFLKNIYDVISDKYDCYFTQVSIIDREGKIILPNIMTAIEKCVTQFDFLKESFYKNSFQIYGLYKKNILEKDFKYFEICQDLKSFNEGLFVHAISATRNIKYVDNAHKLYRKHSENWSEKSLAKELIFSYIIYSIRSLKLLILLKNLSIKEKASLILLKIYIDVKYLIYLSIASIFQYLKLNKFSFFNKSKKIFKKIIF